MTQTSEEYKHILGTLKNVDFFGKLKMGEFELLIGHLKKLICHKGHVIIKEGSAGDAFYMISSGKVAISKKKGLFGRTTLAYLGSGEYFGEMALITHEPRTATVTAEEDCELFVLFSEDFKHILMANPAIGHAIQDVLKGRQASNNIKMNKKD